VARLHANERSVVEALRRLGHDVVTIQETGKGGTATTDRDVLAFAIAEGRTVLTINRRDFVHLHARTPARAGIVVCTLDLDFAGQAERIHSVAQVTAKGLA
jgi:predicted nuclease of predicted toxin-antitoxin system